MWTIRKIEKRKLYMMHVIWVDLGIVGNNNKVGLEQLFAGFEPLLAHCMYASNKLNHLESKSKQASWAQNIVRQAFLIYTSPHFLPLSLQNPNSVVET